MMRVCPRRDRLGDKDWIGCRNCADSPQSEVGGATHWKITEIGSRQAMVCIRCGAFKQFLPNGFAEFLSKTIERFGEPKLTLQSKTLPQSDAGGDVPDSVSSETLEKGELT
jgi:hypothetical protein